MWRVGWGWLKVKPLPLRNAKPIVHAFDLALEHGCRLSLVGISYCCGRGAVKGSEPRGGRVWHFDSRRV